MVVAAVAVVAVTDAAAAAAMAGDVLVGVGWRPAWRAWLADPRADVGCIELTAEHFLGRPDDAVRCVGGRPCSIHCLDLSPGSRAAPGQDYLDALRVLCAAVRPCWVSDHLAFTRAGGVDLGHMNPLDLDERTLARLGDRCEQLAGWLGAPLLLENIATHLQVGDPMAEPAFLGALHARSGVGTLLDVANLHVNACNHGFDPIDWLRRLPPQAVRQVHVVGYGRHGHEYIDDHANAPQPEVLALLARVLAGSTPSHVVLEWDCDLPPAEVACDWLQRLGRLAC